MHFGHVTVSRTTVRVGGIEIPTSKISFVRIIIKSNAIGLGQVLKIK